MESICIIGAGISGIVAARVSLFYDLHPYIYEKNDSIGGLWSQSASQPSVWNSLTANSSKYILAISDHPWPPNTNEFPTKSQMLEYYNSYIRKHDLHQYISFNTTVASITRSNDKYLVTFSRNNEIFQKEFKFVICASGQYTVPNNEFKGKEVFNGEIIHAGYYREPSVFNGKKVVIVGRAVSSGDIGLEAVNNAESVTMIYRKPYVGIKKTMAGVPYDFLVSNILTRHMKAPVYSTLARDSNFAKFIIQFAGNPGDVLEEWRISDEDLEKEFYKFSIHSDEYYEAIKSKQIKCVKGNFTEFYENGVRLEDGTKVPADTVILCTGYLPNFSYLSDDIKQTLNYDAKNLRIPLTLYRSTIHPDLPGLGFVGSFYGPITGRYEFQSELSIRWMIGQLPISQEELWEGVRLEENGRTELKDTCFLYDLGSILQDFFRILQVNIDYEFLESLGYSNGPYCPVFFWKERPGQEELIREFVREIKIEYPQFNFSNP